MNPDLRWRGVFRIPTARMVGGDYTTGAFFVTWCVKGRVECLARIEDGQSFPTLIGMIVDEEWRATAIVRPNVTLDAWIVMPDHVHGILILHDAKETAGMEETAHRAVSTGRASPEKAVRVIPILLPSGGIVGDVFTRRNQRGLVPQNAVVKSGLPFKFGTTCGPDAFRGDGFDLPDDGAQRPSLQP